MSNDFDVAVVGAGPAGSWAAYRLACAGARVAIIDGSHPREKPCGGGLSARALEVLQPIAARLAPLVVARSARFVTSGAAAWVPFQSLTSRVPPLAIASRRDFDAALLQAAQTGGAQHIARRVIAFEHHTRGWTIDTDTTRLSAAWLIGADGANSLVRRRVCAAFSREDLSVASGYYVDGRTSTEIDIEFTDSPAGYLWSFPRVDHLAVGICAEATETSSRTLLDGTRRWILQHAPTTDSALRRYSWPIPTLSEHTLSRAQVSGERWLLIGDAAGLVDPITREGIFFALQSADFAASSILGSDSAAAYARLIRARIHGELRLATRMKAHFFNSSFRPLLVKALARSKRIGAIMEDLIAGRQTYKSLRRRLIMTGEVRLALTYLRVSGMRF